jgi:8-oxo-dGTP diphosphatase
VIRVVAAVIERGGRILICQRRVGDPMAGKWEFPGGKIRRSETPRAALARELREELGVEAKIGGAIYRARHRYAEFATRLEITFFDVHGFFGKPRNLVFQRIVWARRADLSRYDFLAADRVLVARLVRGQI